MILKFVQLSILLFMISACGKKSTDYLITLKTSKGDIKMVLYDQTPRHKENFIKLAQQGTYDGVLFHRVIEDFMIQTGDPQTKPKEDGTEPEKIDYTIPAEFDSSFFHMKGAVAAARLGDQKNPEKASSGSQFYIVQGKKFTSEELTMDQQMLNYYFRQLIADSSYQDLRQEIIDLQSAEKYQELQAKVIEYKDTIENKFDVSLERDYPQKRLDAYTTQGGVPHLDDAYTVFGKVVEGLEVVDKIAAVNTNTSDRPLEKVVLEKVVLEEVSRKKLSKQYDVIYPDLES